MVAIIRHKKKFSNGAVLGDSRSLTNSRGGETPVQPPGVNMLRHQASASTVAAPRLPPCLRSLSPDPAPPLSGWTDSGPSGSRRSCHGTTECPGRGTPSGYPPRRRPSRRHGTRGRRLYPHQEDQSRAARRRASHPYRGAIQAGSHVCQIVRER